VTVVATSFESVRLLAGAAAAKARFTGNPVRDVVLREAGKSYAPSVAGEPFHLLIFGGSQGARFFSETVPPALRLLPEHLQARLSVVQQARPEDVESVQLAYRGGGDLPTIAAEVAPFFVNLPELMAASHLVIGRAGASTVAELTVLGRPSILVPLPHALDNDQLANATRLAEAGGAVCLQQDGLTPAGLAAEIERAMENPAQTGAAAEAAKGQGRPDAVERLADLVMELMTQGDQAKQKHTN
jgi:UDP-N-acetylglucosamine--N-acetylmuramyl-(pentapeptide) pyrophosphoryl-undecaprenol N-acetylglucosamine transferase